MPDVDQTRYILLEYITADGEIANSVEQRSASWRVSEAEPLPESTTQRLRAGAKTYDREAVEDAVIDFFTRMRRSSMTGVLDTGNLRAWHENPLDFTCRLTEEINDDLPDIDDEDFRDDDFDNHPLAPLREAMVENCPEFSGDVPDKNQVSPDI
ncbi:hypothetical protein [Pseudosulfitobacter pseudonitzschiae]|uniref:hypothetical protein n=1 Tax=Pseudosulfitobacter pseudonitzschiae TaxID=1402135 RepID=UPI003B7760DB